MRASTPRLHLRRTPRQGRVFPKIGWNGRIGGIGGISIIAKNDVSMRLDPCHHGPLHLTCIIDIDIIINDDDPLAPLDRRKRGRDHFARMALIELLLQRDNDLEFSAGHDRTVRSLDPGNARALEVVECADG
jgi:hypothetical protein